VSSYRQRLYCKHIQQIRTNISLFIGSWGQELSCTRWLDWTSEP
jgi:hypothetical protein